MSTFRASIVLDANAEDAQSAVRETSQDVRRLGQAGEQASRGTRRLGDAAGSATQRVNRLSDAERRAAASAQQLQAANARGAAAVGNLTSQFNDIGVMMFSGQNPLTLAIQQGTQITQAFGGMGAGAAVRSLGSAFLSMLSPINLITIGTIAAGAALSNWLTSGGEEAKSFTERIDEVTSAVDAYHAAVKAANATDLELREKFGPDTSGARGSLETLEGAAASVSRESLAATLPTFADGLDDVRDMLRQIDGFMADGDLGVAPVLLERRIATLKNTLGLTEEQARALASALDEVASTNSMSEASAPLAEAGAILDAMVAAGGAGAERWKELAAEIAAAELEIKRFAVAEAEQARIAQEHSAGFLASFAEAALKRGEAQAAETAKAQEMLAALQEQNALAQAIRDHGASSAEVAEMRAAAERKATQALIDGMNVSDSLKAALEAAADDAYRLASANFGNISAGATEVERLANALGIAVSQAIALSTLTPDMADEDAAMSVPVLPDASQREKNRKAVDNFNTLTKPTGGGAAAAEASAVKDLIDRLTDELDILRETDPVQKEMLRNREILAQATDAERAEVERLIKARIEEERQTALNAEIASFAGDIATDSLRRMREEGASLIDVLEDVGLALVEAGLQAALLGTGPLANMFGNAGNGGPLAKWVGGLFKGIPGQAGGGPVIGEGGGTEDKVLRRLSNGEYVVNAVATAKNRRLLEMINAGAEIPGLAAGGFAASAPPPPANFGGAPGSVAFQPIIQIDNRSSTPVAAEIEETRTAGGQRAYRLQLSDQVGAALTQPGGGAPRALRNKYGVRQTGTTR